MIAPNVMRQAVNTLQRPATSAFGRSLPAPQRQQQGGRALPAPQLPAPQMQMSTGPAPRQQTAPVAPVALGDLMPPVAPVREAAIQPPAQMQTMAMGMPSPGAAPFQAPSEQPAPDARPAKMGMMRGSAWL